MLSTLPRGSTAVRIALKTWNVECRQRDAECRDVEPGGACPDCNLFKGPNLTGVEQSTQRVVRLFHPRRDKWAEHFALEGSRIVGKTAVGRVTVALFRMNEPQRMRVRGLLMGL